MKNKENTVFIDKKGYYLSNLDSIFYYDGNDKSTVVPVINLKRISDNIIFGFFKSGCGIGQDNTKIIKYLSKETNPEYYL